MHVAEQSRLSDLRSHHKVQASSLHLMVGCSPRFWNGMLNSAAGFVMRTSAASARFTGLPPTAAPLTVTMVGSRLQLPTAMKP